MLNNILNIEGATILSKSEQRVIKGGDTCYLRVTVGEESEIFMVSTNDANADCVTIREAGADRCQYDCGFDGFTADWLLQVQ